MGIYKERVPIADHVEIVHTNGKTGKVTRHVCNSSKLHRLLVKLGLAHNSMTNSGTGGIADIVNLVTGLAAPAAYTRIGIGTGTTADASTDTDLSGGSKYRSSALTPTVTSSSGSLKDQANWTHVFSHANDGTLTGTWAVEEVGIFNAASGVNTMLMHIAGATNYGAVDNCIWDNGDTLSITIVIKFEQGA